MYKTLSGNLDWLTLLVGDTWEDRFCIIDNCRRIYSFVRVAPPPPLFFLPKEQKKIVFVCLYVCVELITYHATHHSAYHRVFVNLPIVCVFVGFGLCFWFNLSVFSFIWCLFGCIRFCLIVCTCNKIYFAVFPNFIFMVHQKMSNCWCLTKKLSYRF